MKKQKNLKNSIADNVLFIIYLAVFTVTPIVFNEIYQIELAERLKSMMNIEESKTNDDELASSPEKKDIFRVEMFSGEIEILNPETMKPKSKNLRVNDQIPTNTLIKTGLKSFLVLSFGTDFKSKMKVGQLTETLLEYKMLDPSEKGEKTLYQQATELVLESGTLLLEINDKYPKDRFKVKTKKAVMGIRGTKFIVSFDKALEKFSVAIEEGLVGVINLVNKTLVEITDGEGYMILKNGFGFNYDIMSIFPNFDIFNNKDPLVDEQAIKDLKPKKKTEEKVEIKDTVKVIEPVSQEQKLYKEQLLMVYSLYDTLVLNFREYLKKQIATKATLEERIVQTEKEIDELSLNLKTSKVQIEKDLICLQSDAKRCSLNTRNLLTSRGFPRILFTEKSKSAMAQELVKYIMEQENKLKSLEERIIIDKEKSTKLDKHLVEAREVYAKFRKNNYKEHLESSILDLKTVLKAGFDKNLYLESLDVEKEIQKATSLKVDSSQ